MRIKLIAPHEHRGDAISSPFKLQRVNLPLLAALTPAGHSVTIVEEAFLPDDMDEPVDLVGERNEARAKRHPSIIRRARRRMIGLGDGGYLARLSFRSVTTSPQRGEVGFQAERGNPGEGVQVRPRTPMSR